jgi:hypothetical protein
MTQDLVDSNLWTATVEVPGEYTLSVNFVFNDGDSTWDSEGSGGRQWRAFIQE